MRTLLPVVVVCVASCALVALSGVPSRAVFLGMAGPLVAVAATWLVAERVHRTNPGAVGSALMAAFGVKVLFFGGYLAIVTKVLDVEIVAFMTSFVIYFIALYIIQAVLVRRLIVSPAP